MANARLDGNYWAARWNNGETQWRDEERSKMPFERNAKLILKELHGHTGDMSPKQTEIRRAFKNATVFIPLCGDTLALGFFAKELGCRVLGIDIAEDSLRKAVSEQFGDREVTESGEDAKGLRRFELPAKKDGEGSVTLYVGDVFALLANRQQYLENVDIVYDRAAMVALQPDKFPKYVELLNLLMTVHQGDPASECQLFTSEGKRTRRAMFLATIERSQDMSASGAPSLQGPPFHVGEEDVFAAFTNVNGGTTRFVTPQFNERHLFESPNPPPFVEATYIVIAQADDHPHPLLDRFTPS